MEIKDVKVDDRIVNRTAGMVYEVKWVHGEVAEVRVVKTSKNQFPVGHHFMLTTLVVVENVNRGTWWLSYRKATNLDPYV